MFQEIINNMAEMLAGNVWLGFLIAFAAGILTFFTPCSLSSLPMIIAYVGGTGATRKKAFLYSLFVVLGETVVFAGIGLVFALLGKVMSTNYIVIGVFNGLMGLFMFWMALEMWNVTNVFSKRFGTTIKTTKTGILGAFLIGLLGGVFASPCDAPVLAAIAGLMMSMQGGIIAGIVMVLMYALGRGILLVSVGTSVGLSRRLAESEKMEKAGKIIKIILGVLILALGVYMISQAVLAFL